MKQVVHYHIEIREIRVQRSSMPPFANRIVIEKRYSDFEALFGQLTSHFKCLCIPCLPPKNFLASLGLIEDSFIEHRGVILTFLLNLMAYEPRLVNSVYLKEFIFGVSHNENKVEALTGPSYLAKMYKNLFFFSSSKLNCEDFFIHSMHIIEQLDQQIKQGQVEIKLLKDIVEKSTEIFKQNNKILERNAEIMKGTMKNAKYVKKDVDLSMNSDISRFVRFDEQSRVEVVNRNKANKVVIEVR